MKRLFIIFFSLSALIAAANPVSSPVTVFECGMGGYAYYRIPALIQAPDGSLIAFAEGRRNGWHDNGDIDMVMRKSEDGGRTWGDVKVVWDDADNTCGNPSPVVEEKTGRIFLFVTWNKGSDKESVIMVGKSEDTRRVFMLWSDDCGDTWSEPEEMTSVLKREGWTWYATGPCHAIQKKKTPHKGRLVVPANHAESDRSNWSHCFWSDDRGKTWHLSDDRVPRGNESTVTELHNGDLMLNMRNSIMPADSCRMYAISKDGGKSWSEPRYAKELIEPRCQGCIINYNPKGKPSKTLLFSNPHTKKGRRKMTVSVSHDSGKTWSEHHLIDGARAAYSDMTVFPDGSVGILYEKDRYTKIVWRILKKK